MFAWSGGFAAPSLTVDPEKEREAPPPPTPLQFPTYDGFSSSGVEITPEKLNCDSLCHLLSRIKKPQDITEDYLKALNVSVDPNFIEISDIVPGGVLKSRAPYQWGEEQGRNGESNPVSTSSGFPFPDQEKYNAIRDELLVDKEDAFRALGRLDPLPGGKRVRVTYSRKFWTGLEQVVQYWDSSLDQYFERLPENENKEDESANDKESAEEVIEDKMDIDPKLNQAVDRDTPGEEPEDRMPKLMYKGRRIGCGKYMPEAVREDTLRGFIETVAWSFGCQVKIPNMAPRLLVKTVLFPVRHTFVVSRVPQDRQIAKKGVLEGPIILCQCRGETAFPGDDMDSQFKYVQICDVLREVAGMLLFAQERARDGLDEVKPGDGMWWTTEARWGGAQNNGPVGTPIIDENGNAIDDSSNGGSGKSTSTGDIKGSPAQGSTATDAVVVDAVVKATEQPSNKRTRHDRNHYMPRRSSSGASRKMSMHEKWKMVQAGHGLWDKKVKYMKIGGDKDKPYDDIYMISSLNHHISIVHLRIHSNYLEWLASGKTEFPEQPSASNPGSDSEQAWHRLAIRRTRWFDLLNPVDRIEAFDGIWALFTWVMR